MYYTGDKYDGELKNNMINGKGKLEYSNGDVYDGDWRNGLKHGKGNIVTQLQEYSLKPMEIYTTYNGKRIKKREKVRKFGTYRNGNIS